MENNIELQEMREQLASFKQQLAGQKIINDRLMRKAMAEKASRLKRERTTTLVFGIVAIFVSVPIFYMLGFPNYFLAYSAAMVIFSMAMTVIYHSKVDKADFMNGDLKSAAIEVKKLRNRYSQWLWIAAPLILGFIALFYHSSLHLDANREFIRNMMTGGIIGGVIGAIIGICMNRKTVRLCDELIADLDGN